MTGKINLEPTNREHRYSCSPAELCCLCSYIPTWNGVGGFGAVSLGASTRLVQPPEKGRREQEVRDRLNGSLLINFRFFSPLPTLDAMQYTEEQQQQRSQTYTGRPNVWVRCRGTWSLNDSMSSSISFSFFFVHMWSSGWNCIDEGGSYTAPRPMSRVFPFTKRRWERERGGIRFKSLAWPILFPIRTTHRREMG